MKKIIYPLKYVAIPLVILTLSACNILTPVSPTSKICKDIALDRLKHPGSYEGNTQSEIKPRPGQTEVTLTFSAWNDYKVPMPQSIFCLFQTSTDSQSLLSVKWNGYPVREHELDDIRAGLKN